MSIKTTDSLDNYCDTVSVAWAVCNLQLCFNGSGAWASFPIIQLTDTVKVCYSAYVGRDTSGSSDGTIQLKTYTSGTATAGLTVEREGQDVTVNTGNLVVAVAL